MFTLSTEATHSTLAKQPAMIFLGPPDVSINQHTDTPCVETIGGMCHTHSRGLIFSLLAVGIAKTIIYNYDTNIGAS